MNKPELSPEQQRVVCHGEGPLLLIASAGSGKTRVLTERVRYLMENKTGHYHLLALTFTNKAADEMRKRLDVDEQEEHLYIGNIHKFCMQIICNRGHVIGLSREPQIFDRKDCLDILRQAFDSEPRLQQYLQKNSNNKYFLKDILDNISLEKKNLRSPCDDTALLMDNEKQNLAYLYEKYNEILLNQNALDFDDILVFTYQIFNEFPRITAFYRRLYRYICIDEAQDLNFAQYHVIKSLCGQEMKNLMLVGDPKQAIYGFNGASSDFMTKHFIQDFDVPKENQFELTENYRSSKRIIATANLLQPSSMKETDQAKSGDIQALSFPNEDAEADWVLNRLQMLKQEGHPDVEGAISWENCAVLGRTRYVMLKLEEKLKQLDIPYYYKRTQDYIESESEFIRCFELGMRLLMNPQNRLHFQKLLKLLHLEDFGGEIDRQNWQNGFDLLTWINSHIKTDFAPHFERLLTAWQSLTGDQIKFREVGEDLEKYSQKTYVDEERALVDNDIRLWLEHWRSYVKQTDSERRCLPDFLTQVSLGATHQLQNHGLALLTVHTAKGLEFEVVCIMGMCEGVFPDYRAVKKGGIFMREEDNNIYVALTRSKRIAYFTSPLQKLMPWGAIKRQQASRYLKKMKLTLK